MADRTLRTISASVVLVGIATAALIQIGNNQDTTPAEMTAAETSTTVAPATTSSEADTSTTLPAPFVYRVGVLAGVSTENFWAFYGEQPSVWNSYILGPTKPAMFTANATQDGLQPELAVSRAEPIRDAEGWSVRVALDPDLAWSDGVDVTAHDLEFTFETVRDLGLGGSWSAVFPDTVRSIHAEGNHHVRIEFTERPPLSVWPHGVGLAPIMAKHIWESKVEGRTADELYEMDGSGDVGGGPLVVAEVTDDLIISKRNPGYPLADPPDTIEYHIYPDEPAAVAALGDGDIDVILSPKGLANEHLAAIESDPGVDVVTNPGNGIRYLGFNLERAPMSEQAFRTALVLLLERESLASSIAHTGAPAWSLVSPDNSQWFDSEAAAANAALHDGSLAERLGTAIEGLTAAGYAWSTPPSIDGAGELVPGSGLTIDARPPQPLTILTPGDAYDPARPDYVREIAKTLGVLGFDTRPVVTDFDTVVDLVFTPGEDGVLHYDMYLLGWTLGNPTLPGYYRALFAPDGAMNNTGYASGTFNAALEAYERAVTKQDAFRALWEMERTLAVELPYMLLYRSEITEAYRADRVEFDVEASLGGLQARLGGIWDVSPAG